MLKLNEIYQIVPYYPPSLGGMQKCVKIISDLLSDRGYRVTVLTSDVGINENRNDKKKYTKENLTVKYLASIEIANTPISYSLIPELLKIPKDALVHLHIANAYFPELVYLVSKIKGFKYIAHLHIDVERSGKAGYLLPIYKSFILKTVLKNADKVIVLTDSFSDLLINKYGIGKSKIVVIPNGVDERFFIKKQVNTIAPYSILFVGRLSPQKNLTVLINAFSKLKLNANLTIVGEGSEEVKLKKLVSSYGITKVNFVGRKDENELIPYYAKADIFCLPSNTEGMSLAMLEAMASGLPMAAADLPQYRNIVEKGTYFVKNNTSDEYLKAIMELLTNPKLRKTMSLSNIKTASQYKWNKILLMIEKVYLAI